jgi:hypothetical protein
MKIISERNKAFKNVLNVLECFREDLQHKCFTILKQNTKLHLEARVPDA